MAPGDFGSRNSYEYEYTVRRSSLRRAMSGVRYEYSYRIVAWPATSTVTKVAEKQHARREPPRAVLVPGGNSYSTRTSTIRVSSAACSTGSLQLFAFSTQSYLASSNKSRAKNRAISPSNRLKQKIFGIFLTSIIMGGRSARKRRI